MNTPMNTSIVLNGQPHAVPCPISIPDLLQSLNLHPNSIVIEVNTKTLFKHKFDETMLQNGDQVEILQVVAGG